MDGSNRRVIIEKDVHWPNGLAIDYKAEKIYWVDAKLFHIAAANYDGTKRKNMFKSSTQCTLAHPFAMTLYENKIFWTDWTTKGIHCTNKSSLECREIWTTSYSPMDIRTYEPQRQRQKPGNTPICINLPHPKQINIQSLFIIISLINIYLRSCYFVFLPNVIQFFSAPKRRRGRSRVIIHQKFLLACDCPKSIT